MQAITVVYNGESHTLGEPKLSDLVAFEKQFKVPASVMDGGDEIYVEWVAFLLFRSLRKAGLVEKTVAFDEDFLDGIESFEANEIAEGDDTSSVPLDQEASLDS